MGTLGKILAVVDPTAEQQPAVARAAWLARNLGCGLELFICHHDPYLAGERFFDSPDLAAARDGAMAAMRGRLADLAAPLAADGLEVITDAAWDTPLHEGIVRKAVRSGAQMVVKDTHHHHALKRAVFSNTDWNLIRSCPVGLWLVKPGPLAQHPVLLAAVDPMHEHDRPAELDHDIVQQATAIAAASGGTVHLGHAYDPLPLLTGSTAYPLAAPVALPVDSIAERMRAEHDGALRRLAVAFDIDEGRAHLLRGSAREVLVELAERLHADAVVMGAVARGALQRVFIGSTAEQVLDRLPCDVVIVKPRRFDSDVASDDARGNG